MVHEANRRPLCRPLALFGDVRPFAYPARVSDAGANERSNTYAKCSVPTSITRLVQPLRTSLYRRIQNG